MSANPTHPEVRRLEIPGANYHFHYFDVDGMVIPLFTGFLIDGPANRLRAIRDMDTGQDDVLLTAYPKSGMWPSETWTQGKMVSSSRHIPNQVCGNQRHGHKAR